MRCIFCKRDSTRSRSVEHIVPEALGNKEHKLPRGIVCDTCNNYFARKVEGPLLQTPYFKHVRSRQWIANKRGYIPGISGLVPAIRQPAEVWLAGNRLVLAGRNENEDRKLAEGIVSGRVRSVWFAMTHALDNRLMARFLAKVALEVLAQRLISVDGWEQSLIDDPQLDSLRRFARIGDEPRSWPFNHRRIYGEDDCQIEGGASYQLLHEYTLLYTEACELYAVICIFGEEFVINLAGPEIEGYTKWLEKNAQRSPLYLSDALPMPG
jgi:hypothetical protein